MSEDIQNSEAAPVEDSGTASVSALLSGRLDEGNGTAAGAGEQIEAALLELAAHAHTEFHAQRCWKPKAKAWGYEPVDTPITEATVRDHLSPEGPHLGIYPITPGEDTIRFAAFDLDDHDGDTGWDKIAEAAQRLIAALDVLCCHPLIFRSGGGDGIHIFLFWDTPQLAKDVRGFMNEVLAGAGFKSGAAGVGSGEIEVFPKQNSVSAGKRGNLIALPLARKSEALSPALVGIATWSLRHSPPASMLAKLADVRSALMAITDDPHDRWVSFGIAIRGQFDGTIPDAGYGAWHEWSARNPDKFDERECAHRWRSFSPESDSEQAITIGSIFWTASKEYGWRAPKAKGGAGPDPDKVSALLRGAVYCVGVKRFIDLSTLTTPYDKEQFNDKNAVDFPVGCRMPTASTIFINHPEARKVHSPTYHPGRELFITWEGLPRVNQWRPTDLVRYRADVTPFLDHAAFVVPNEEERNVILDWMAYTVQHQDKKINWAIFLGGSPGIGKDTLFLPLIQAVGEHNTSIIKADNFSGSFTDWMERKLIVVEEMAAFGKREMVNDIKPLLAAPPNKLRINKKFETPYDVPNISNFVFFSNQRDALPIEPDERRYFVCWSPAEKRPPAYYTELHTWIAENAGAVYDWLMDRDVSKFHAQGRAPETDAMRAMVKVTRTPLEQHIAARIEEEVFPFSREIVTVADVIAALPPHIRNASDVKVADALKACGATRLSKQAQLPDRKPAVWALRQPEVYNAMTPSQLGKILSGEKVADTSKDDGTGKVVALRSANTPF